MKYFVAALTLLSTLAHGAAVPQAVPLARRQDEAKGIDLNKPVALVVSETLRGMVQGVLAGATVANAIQSFAESFGANGAPVKQ